MKLLRTAPLPAGNSARMFAAAGEIRLSGIKFPLKAVRFAPVLSPVVGSYTCPPPAMPAVRYWLKLQKPGVELAALVAGLQLWTTCAVGTVNVPLTPLVWRVPW